MLRVLNVCAPAARVACSAPARRVLATRAMSTVVRFTKDHEYVRVEGTTATCGITDFAQTQLGDVVYVSLPEVGAKYNKGDSFASVESVKAASDVYAPVSGTVSAVNKELADSPAMVNEAAESRAWFVKLTLSNPKELDSMMDEKTYKKHCEDSKQ